MTVRDSGTLDTNTYSSTWGVDYAKDDPEALSYDRMNQFLGEIIEQPRWRERADIEADYYDSNQYSIEDLQNMKAKGIPPIVVNLIAPAINMVLGLEAKTRTDWVVKAEIDQYEEAALALGVKLKEGERMSGADRAISDAYAGQVKTGLGWVEVGYNKANPFGYRYRCESIHRREIWWDWHDHDAGLSKARYLVRRKWYDEDVAIAYFPQYKDLIHNAVRGWAGWDPTIYDTAVPYYMDDSVERTFAWSEEEWRDTLRRRVCLYEVWYRTVERGFIIRYSNGKVVEFDEKNPVQAAAIHAGLGQLEASVIPKMRMSWWLGPHRLVDIPTPYPHQEFPYVPFWGFREDRTGVPYGMIRAMRPLQDEVNARRARMLWQLSAKRVFIDEDATSDHGKLQREVARPDVYAKINTQKGKRAIGDMIKVEDNSSLTAQQFEVYADSKQTLQDAGGIYQQQLGKKGAADSGIAISQLIEQGTTTLAEINDNHQTGRKLVGDRLMSLIVSDMKGRPSQVPIERMGKRKSVKFNTPKTDKTTNTQYLENDTTRMQMSVVLAELPATPTYRMQQFMQLTDFVKGLPEQLQTALVDIVINASDIPDKQEVLKRVRETLGIGGKDPNEMNQEELQQYQQQQQEQAAQKAIQNRMQLATVQLEESKVAMTNSTTELNMTKSDQAKVEANLNPELTRRMLAAESSNPSGPATMPSPSPAPQPVVQPPQ